MLEMPFVRENPDVVRKDLQKRGLTQKIKVLDELIEKDSAWRKKRGEIDKLRSERNTLSSEINSLLSRKKDASSLMEKAKGLPGKIKKGEGEADLLAGQIRGLLMGLPNILDASVPEGKDENDNVEIRRWGSTAKKEAWLKHHGEFAQEKNLADFRRGVKLSGSGFYFLKGGAALLDLALQRFAIDELMKKGFTLIAPPLMMRRAPYEGVVDMEDFKNVMYKIEGEDLYLIATSEHPIAAMFQDEIINSKELPLKFVGVSPCFRKEIGKHSIDERGLFRVHQFNKIEQLVFCLPEQSGKVFDELIANAESLVKKLGVPYRVVNICTGDIGTIASKKHDIDAWSPREQKFIEIISCSDCGSYQASRLKTRYRKGAEKGFLCTLNSTAIATSRLIRVLIEQNQTEKGTVIIPKPLMPYMGNSSEIPL